MTGGTPTPAGREPPAGQRDDYPIHFNLPNEPGPTPARQAGKPPRGRAKGRSGAFSKLPLRRAGRRVLMAGSAAGELTVRPSAVPCVRSLAVSPRTGVSPTGVERVPHEHREGTRLRSDLPAH